MDRELDVERRVPPLVSARVGVADYRARNIWIRRVPQVKVGTLTFHRAWNYGAVLQAYALQRSLESLGVECEVIDYRCEELERNYRVLSMSDRRVLGFASALAHLPSRVKSRARFQAFRTKYLRCSNRPYSRTDVSSASLEYDYLVVGSDQVWNPGLTGGDMSYFLDFSGEGSKKISYAASLGKRESIGANDALYLRHLRDFRAVSVRESDSRVHLAALLGRDVSWVMDPVFLLSAGEWEPLCAITRKTQPYIFVYCLHELQLYEYAARIQAISGFDVVYVPQSLKAKIVGHRVVSPSVEEFLGYIRNAELVITDSFHVLAFSMVFHRHFKVQLKDQLADLNSRVLSLLESVGLEQQVLSSDDYECDVLPVVDYTAAEGRIRSRVEESIEYLRDSLELSAGS
ncbi:MAG: polysaccharide pyruvyl transferase family protein [Coriobacteriia bacterium]|nr:polysaccharide pyruvyl transferase family protein [Coriobacteriia bacterium]